MDKLQEEYRTLTGGTPFLAELTEDIEPEIERMTPKVHQAVIRTLGRRFEDGHDGWVHAQG